MWLRIAANFKIACIPEVLGKKRLHSTNISHNGELTLRSRIIVWQNAKYRFPALTPASVIHRLLADTYLQLAAIDLVGNQSNAARAEVLMSLAHAFGSLVSKRDLHSLSTPYRWFNALMLLPLAFMGSRITHWILKGRGYITRNSHALMEEL